MALGDFNFDPATGWNDTDKFPDYPARDQVRPLLQKLFDQIKTWLNVDLKTFVNGIDASLTSHKAENVSYVTVVTRDMSLDGVQSVSLPFKPKALHCIAYVHDTKMHSDAVWSQNTYSARFYNASTDKYRRQGTALAFLHDGTNTFSCAVENVTDTGFDLNWTKTGTPSSSATLTILAIGHGEG
jgi:hypothetical protein